MKAIVSELHDACVATYQTLEADQLNAALKECGVGDVQQRRQIIEAFLFQAGQMRDAGWFEEAGRRFRPVVCFEEISATSESMNVLHIPDPDTGTMFHEYAHGATAWLFDDHQEDASEIVTGEVSP